MEKLEAKHDYSRIIKRTVVILSLTILLICSTLVREARHNTNQLNINRINSLLFPLNIAIIGSSGYIGSRLLNHLKGEKGWNVIGFDRIYPGQASYQIPTKVLRRFQVVIYLGGLTDGVMCRDHPADVKRENVDDIKKLAKRMLSSQLLIFASTSAIAEGSGSTPFSEDSPVQSELFDSYVSSLFDRENTLRNLSIMSTMIPQMIGLRFGIVIGLSPKQRIDLVHMALVCQVFLNGKLPITHPESNRALLSMEDLLQAVTVLIKNSKKAEHFDIFHLQSFSASISNIANAIAFHSGGHIHPSDHPVKEDSPGFSLNATKFSTTFNFVFKENQDQIISRLIDDVPRFCLGSKSLVDNNSIPCVVCGSRVMHTVLDLHSQPLANDFRTRVEESKKCKRFPLRLVRCPICHHTQLSTVVDRKYLFSHYLYQSGTSQTSRKYFEWLAEKVVGENPKINGTVLEIACNDGSQLNEFSKRGWNTYGVDPAKNLVELARAQNHTVYNGFWGTDEFSDLPSPDSLNVIIAQNVLAHVENPVEFLRACVARMSMETTLYIQTSQYEMYETAQFDTVYHEHISFFTAHSFRKIADLVGLRIINFEITPIHGRSCLVTFRRMDPFLTIRQKENAPSLALAFQKEQDLGMTESWFYIKYQAQALVMRQWIVRQLDTLSKQGHTIIAYGAAAKGMVLLHSLLEIGSQSWNFAYVIDDAPLKQNTFCPGTTIPVRPTSELSKHDVTKPLTILVFAWNFWEEIYKKILTETVDKGINHVFVILPFPHQQLIKLNSGSDLLLSQNAYKPLPWPTVFRPHRSVILISHFFNEEFLLPFWIRHHAPMFDLAILIDYNSNDRSLEIIRREAPSSWRIVTSRNSQFIAHLTDQEVMDYERMYPDAWKIALTTTEFLVHQNLRNYLAEIEQSNDIQAFRFRSVWMSGNDSIPFQRLTNLLKQRTMYFCDPIGSKMCHGESPYSRFLHRYPAIVYKSGRHELDNFAWHWAPIGFIAKFTFTPWPEILNRKLQIRSRMPASEFALGNGIHHNVGVEDLQLTKKNLPHMPNFDLRDLNTTTEDLVMVHRLWKEITDY
jgi:nucleoside-diphosphate-sugar epimerase/2-polyprenyl-3-methyl-5-hydroxy-6-metoxy-1,4-benzoquinol methylase